MRKLKNLGQLLMALVITITSVFGNAFVVFADTNPNAGKVTATKTAERIGDETSRSAKVKITVSGNPYTITEQSDREIVLVLDSSGSMKDYLVNASKSKLDTLKDATDAFIDSLLVEENKGKIKIGVVWYDTNVTKTCALSDDAAKLDACLNSEEAANGGTNVQEGIREAKKLFTDKKNEKDLIVLSDGLPTFFTTVKDGVQHTHGTGKTDEHESLSTIGFTSTSDRYELNGNYVRDGYVEYEDRVDGTTYKCEARGYYLKYLDWLKEYEIVGACDAGYMKKPSEAAKEEAESFTGKIYSIGFGVGADSDAEKFLQSIVKNGGRYFDASDSAKLNEAFAAVSKDIEVIAKDLTIRDVVPNTFTVDKVALKEKYGDAVEIIEENNQTIIIYKFNELSSKKPEELEFTVTAQDDYYGSMYTNSEASVTGTASDGNKFYENVDGKIKEDLINPVAPIAVKANPDQYETYTNEELSRNEAQGVRNNDSSVKSENEVKSVLDKVRLVTDAKYGKLTLNENGSFTYNPNQNFRGNDSFTYYVETTIEDKNGNKTITKSEVTTATITVKGVKASYIVNYLEKGTNTKVADSKTISKNANNGDLCIGDKVTEYALTLNNYNLVSNNQESITLAKEGNVINFYYELKDSKIVVHYVEKDTNTKLADDDTFDGKVTETKVINAKDIKDYVVVGSKTQNATFDLTTNEYTFYYEKAESAGAIAHHYIIDNNGNKTTTELFKDDVVNGKIGTSFSFSAKTEGLGDYEYVESKGTTSGTLTSKKQEATFYYQLKKTDVTVRYVTIKDGNVIDLINPVKDTGRINDNYTAYAKDETDNKVFANYNLESATEQTIKLKSSDNTITFIYSLKDAKVIVHHYEEGTTIKIAEDETINGKVSKDYTTKEADVYGYTLVNTPENASGIFTDEVTEVIYYYKKDMGKVITKYVDEDGKVLLEETTTNGQVGTDYQTSPATITDYELINTIGEVKGKYTKEDIVVTYVYQFVMGEGGDDTNGEPDIPYTGIEGDSYLLEYSLMGTSALGLILLAILKKKFN
ncbi:MAG: hypothetical protein DBY43_03525 [Clostridiaceae bacterium]|nr:MAG: hypothetical protein DBY43_03525 [Clostridiaceae bacterium]